MRSRDVINLKFLLSVSDGMPRCKLYISKDSPSQVKLQTILPFVSGFRCNSHL